MSNEFTTEITTDEWDLLADAIGQWESSEDSFLSFLAHLKQVGDPPPEFLEEAPEGFEAWWHDFKKEMLGREQKAKDVKKERMEQATFIKTKIILKKRAAMDELADNLFNAPPELPKVEPPPEEPKPEEPKLEEPKSEESKDKSIDKKPPFKFQPPPPMKPKQKKPDNPE